MWGEDWFSALHGPDADIWRAIDWTEIHKVRIIHFTFMLRLVLCGYTSGSWRVAWGKSHLRAQWKWQRRRWAWGHRWRCQSGKLLWTWGCPQWPAGGCTGTLPQCTATTLLHREQAGLGKTRTCDRAGEWWAECAGREGEAGWGLGNSKHGGSKGEWSGMKRKARTVWCHWTTEPAADRRSQGGDKV